MISEDLAIALLSRECHLAIAKRRRDLDTVLNWYWLSGEKYNEECGEIIAAIVLYDEKFGRTPSRKELTDFIITEGFDSTSYGRTEDVLEKLKELPETSSLTEAEPLLSAFVEMGRTIHLRFGLVRAYELTKPGAMVLEKGDKKHPATLDDAKRTIMKTLASDLTSASPEPEGRVDQNTAVIEKDLQDALHPQKSDRMLTTWPHVDKCVPIGHKYAHYIGIAAYTGHYKTSAAMTFAYEWSKQGFNGLYVTKEIAPRVMWRRYAFMWLCDRWKREGNRGYPPSEYQWMMTPEQITPEYEEQMRAALAEIEKRQFGFGKMDFRNFRTYEETVQFLVTTHAEERWDFLVIDYPHLFEQPLSGKNFPNEHQQAINDVFRKLLDLSNTFDDNRGLVVVSCLQIKKSGSGLDAANKQKKSKDGGDPKRYDGVDCIEWYTAAASAMHFCFGLWKEPDGYGRRVWYDTLKVRDGMEPVSRWLDIDAKSRRLYDHAAMFREDPASLADVEAEVLGIDLSDTPKAEALRLQGGVHAA